MNYIGKYLLPCLHFQSLKYTFLSEVVLPIMFFSLVDSQYAFMLFLFDESEPFV